MQTGVRSGDGTVAITFDPDDGGCSGHGAAPPAAVAVVATARFTG